MDNIQLFKATFHIDECLESIRECLEIGWTGMGFKTVELEKKWCEYTGHPYAHFVNSATSGLHLAVQVLKEDNHWSDDNEVISTPITFVSTNHSILKSNLKCVFADVDEYFCLDPKSVEEKITDKTVAVMYMGYGGRVGKLEEILNICKKHNLKLILDAAHMAGTRVNGVTPGTFEGIDATVYSFQAVKNLPTGDSGMVCFAREEDDSLARKLSWLGISKDTYQRTSENGYKWKYEVDYLGDKYHGNSVMAAIGLVQLKYLDEGNEYRRRLARVYTRILEKDERIKIVPANYSDECCYHLFVIEVKDRDRVMDYLTNNGISTGVHYRDNTDYKVYEYAKGTVPVAHERSQHILSLPMHLQVSEEDAERIAKLVIEALD